MLLFYLGSGTGHLVFGWSCDAFYHYSRQCGFELLHKVQNLDEEAAINVVANTIHNHDQSAVISYYPTFNPNDKVVEILERTIKEKDKEIARLRKGKKQ